MLDSLIDDDRSEYSRGDDFEDVFICTGCGREDDEPSCEVKGQPYCSDCLDICPECGDFIHDTTTLEYGAAVQYRRWEVNGALSKPTHAMCAASDLLRIWSGDKDFEVLEESRDAIAAVAMDWASGVQGIWAGAR